MLVKVSDEGKLLVLRGQGIHLATPILGEILLR
jgi:hypothetical protein